MDRPEKKSSKRQSGKVPEVPIQTYRWEDLRRSRRKGGYPWTYLYKEVFDESDILENFKMEGLKKNKTSSASSASDSLEIKEITEDDIKGLEGIDSSYVVIESPILLGRQVHEPVKEQEGIIESADSSDNISQYLDREERGPEHLESTETLTLPVPSTNEAKQMERAKSEEPKRKRKLSVESNYSRISLSKLGMMKRLKDAKDKIKLPKFGNKTKKEKITEKPVEELQLEKTNKKSNKNEKPVYIHIPLKPPEGEKDEFSHLEFEDKNKPAPPVVQIEIAEEEEVEQNKENIPEEEEQNSSVAAFNENNLGLSLPNDQEDDVSAIIFLEGEEGCDTKGDYDIIAVDIDENSQEMKMSPITNTEVRRQVLESIKKVESQPDIAKNVEASGTSLSRSSSKASKVSKSSIRKRRAKSVEPEKKRRGSIDSSYSRKSLSRIGLMKKLKQIHIPFLKSQSKHSITETSSNPKETVQKEPEVQKEIPKQQMSKEKPVYIHIPLKPPEGQTDEFSHLEFDTGPSPQPILQKNDTIDTESDMSPIDTPKSPQFIVLTPPSDDELLDRPDIPETPSSETGSLFQFGELQQLAKNAVDQILESVEEEADKDEENTNNSQVTVETKDKEETIQIKLETINKKTEDSENIQVTPETTTEELETKDKEQEDPKKKNKLIVDEEDGLKSESSPNDENKLSLKSNLKGEISPLPKKKVSFKRRKSSQVSRDDGYEEIGVPSSSVTVESSAGVSDNAVEVSTTDSIGSASSRKEELDAKTDKETKTSTSSEEENRRWSKISDHEYEPINPPAEEKTAAVTSRFHVSEVLNPPSAQTHQYSDDELDLSLRESQPNMDSHVFHAPSKNVDFRSSPGRSSPSKGSTRSRSQEKDQGRPNKFQTAIKEGATKFKSKLQGIKKPNISMPSRPKFSKPNFRKPNINLPKLPDISSTFRRSPKTDEIKPSQTGTTEDSGSKGIFNFSTYPRIFKKKKRDLDSTSLKDNEEERVQKRTRQAGKSVEPVIIRIPLHSEASLDKENGIYPEPEEILEVGEIAADMISSPQQYQEDTEVDDEDERIEFQEEQRVINSEEENSRWDHGNFYRSQNGDEEINDEEKQLQNEQEKVEEFLLQENGLEDTQAEMVTDLDLPDEVQTPFIPVRQKGRLQQNESFETNNSRDVGSSVSSLGHRRGVLEEIDSDQFFLREKGISQDNIDMGKYLSTEIREAFRSPANALSEFQSFNFEQSRASNQSLPETKRKQVKKPKRRKTPHTSQERLRYEPESENEDYNFMPPIRPKRRSRRKKRTEPQDDTISLDRSQRTDYSPDRENIPRHYENNQRAGMQYMHVEPSDPLSPHRLQIVDLHDSHRRASEPIPAAPPRKHKSLKSLNASEHESIFEDYERNEDENNIDEYNKGAFTSTDINHIHPSSDFGTPIPPKPPTRCRSKTRSISRATSQADRDSILGRMDSIMFDEEFREPVVEEPCIKDLRDSMGYAIVDKNQNKNWEHKFCTVPKSHGRSQPPERPLRNYSTLGPSRPERKLSRNMTDEEKENVDISQYIEIEDERDLQSGEVIQKIQNRPLPAPPRPPRSKSKPLSDITSRSNVDIDAVGDTPEEKYDIDETEVSTQTEPLPPDFQCEEMVQEETDKIMTPSAMRKNNGDKNITEDVDQNEADIRVDRILTTPTQLSYEETITHSQLLVEPLDGARILPDLDISNEKIIPITNDEGEESEIPEDFNKLTDPKEQSEPELLVENTLPENSQDLSNQQTEVTPDYILSTNHTEEVDEPIASKMIHSGESIISDDEKPLRPPRTASLRSENVEILKTQKLQVSDLDVERLTVNELVANKIVVSEIEGGNISTHEISSKGGTLKLTDLDLSPEVVKKLFEQFKESSNEQHEPKSDGGGEKKTPSDFRTFEEPAVASVSSIESYSSETVRHSEDIESNLHHSPENINSSLLENSTHTTENCPEYQSIEISPESAETKLSSIHSSEDAKDEQISKKIEDEEKSSNLDIATRIAPSEDEKIVPDEIENSEKETDGSEPPVRPPRYPEKKQSICEPKLPENVQEVSEQDSSKFIPEDNFREPLQLLEPEVDEEPPPRPPQPRVPYIPSKPPSSFYALRAPQCVEDLSEDIPLVPRRKRNHRITTISKSSSSESSSAPVVRRRVRSPEPSIPQLTGQLMGACSIVARNKIKRLIDEVNIKISKDTDADINKQNIQVIMVVLLILIAILLLLGYGHGKTVHLHHWEYFNPPTDI